MQLRNRLAIAMFAAAGSKLRQGDTPETGHHNDALDERGVGGHRFVSALMLFDITLIINIFHCSG
ncbi:hypothetical protein AWB83_05358 [Caballeronia ptereochthonis]|uniref:Uncharacterized protein n=1 Tax=Caballeronia ptereochthonis TaxID=1777144 RepID=A0A158DDU1_9BURK|nr:hypothetical protein AWB83_05358 [Caballeronia ptereochthonis]